jgi:glycosyltransferase involved in cell wall biosynthesis
MSVCSPYPKIDATIEDEASGSYLISMPERPLVSILMPVYKAEKTVFVSIQSVLQQSYSNWELIAVVDGSPDNSLAALESFSDSRIRIINQENQGVSAARNNAFKQANGEYIAFLDSDDIWLPEYLETSLETLRKNNSPVGYTYSWYYAFDDNYALVNLSPAFTDSGFIFDAVVQKENLIIPSTSILHRSIFEDLEGFTSKAASHEDFLFFLRASKKYPGFSTQQRTVLYRQSLSGKGRCNLLNYESSKKSYINESPAIAALFEPEDFKEYLTRQKKTVFYGFMMYNQMNSAKKIFSELSPSDIVGDLKGKLCLLSLMTNINFLYLSRLSYQFTTRFLLKFWWKRKLASFFPNGLPTQ